MAMPKVYCGAAGWMTVANVVEPLTTLAEAQVPVGHAAAALYVGLIGSPSPSRIAGPRIEITDDCVPFAKAQVDVEDWAVEAL